MHLGAATSADPARRDTHFDASQERYLRKHYGPIRWQLARGATIIGSAARGVVLAGERGRHARARAAFYVTGPLESEAALLATRPGARRGGEMPVSLRPGPAACRAGDTVAWLARWRLGVGYFIPDSPRDRPAVGVCRLSVRADADGLRDHSAAHGGPRPRQLSRSSSAGPT